MRVLHQVTTTNEAGEVESTLDVNGIFLLLAGWFALAAIDSIMDGFAKIRAEKLKGPGSNSTCSH